jgi:hypothetical protein
MVFCSAATSRLFGQAGYSGEPFWSANPMRPLIALSALLTALVFGGPALHAAPCTAKDFAAVVDQSGASLRALTLAAQPKLQERMRRYKAAKKLSDADYENSALDAIQDPKLAQFDEKSGALLMTVDSLSRVPDGTEPDCSKLDKMKAAASELNKVIKAKSDYMLKRLDEKIAAAEKGSAPAKPETAPAEPKKKTETVESATRVPPPAPKPATPPPAATPPPPPTQDWAARTKPNDAYPGPDIAMREGEAAGASGQAEDGYTIDEIRDATRGFFGTISTSLASVIEHAFKQQGRPTAYVLGIEGGGAFLAGLRFGKGTLYMRSLRGTRQVYWHGPSVGTDFGASGSRTIFLIYRMQDPNMLFRNFTGIDGSAYFVGGVGVTLLKGGPVIMAPIRSGVGMRLGANLGYVRFTEEPTWNPF